MKAYFSFQIEKKATINPKELGEKNSVWESYGLARKQIKLWHDFTQLVTYRRTNLNITLGSFFFECHKNILIC